MRRPYPVYNDDWFNLGLLLAGHYNKNYEDRGRNKGLNTVDEMFSSPTPTDEDMKNALAAQKNKLIQNPGKLTDLIPREYNFNPGENANTPVGLTTTIPDLNPGKSTGGLPDSSSGGLFSKYGLSAEKPSEGLFEQFLKTDPERMLAMRNAITPDESIVNSSAAAIAKDRLDNDFNSTDFLADVNKSLLKMNLTPDAMKQVLEYAGIKAKEKQRSLDERKTNELLGKYNNLIKAGNYQNAFELLPQIAKYNQPAAQMLLGSAVTPRDIYNTDKQDARDTKNFERNKGLMELRSSYGGYSGGGRSAPRNLDAKPPAYLGVLGQQMEKTVQAIDNNDNELSGKEIDKMKQLYEKYRPNMSPEDAASYQANIYALLAIRELNAGYLETALQYASALPADSLKKFGIDINGLKQAVNKRKPREREDNLINDNYSTPNNGLNYLYLDNFGLP